MICYRAVPRPRRRWVLVLLAAVTVRPIGAYSQFTHEELIDITWSDTIRPLLLQRYPGATERALVRAHAYAYGGCLIQDIGYYPFGKRFFSDLTHYARSGDFVLSLLRNAASIDEFAFAIGALSHYIGDSIGHSQAVNPATAMTFPDLAARFGGVITYEEAPTAHVRTEFGFDVAQTALHRYAARRYRKKIGFRVARELLYRSFQETYGVPAAGILGPARSAASSYRWSVTTILPAFLAAQLVLLSDQLPRPTADPGENELAREISATEYAARGMQAPAKPGIRAHLFALLICIVPKTGVLKALSTKAPSIVSEELFVRSVVGTLSAFRDHLGHLAGSTADLRLPDLDLDTGAEVSGAQSRVVDEAHVKLALVLARRKAGAPPDLRAYLLSYFAGANRIERLPADDGRKAKLEDALKYLEELK
jgi:hypothetical protein